MSNKFVLGVSLCAFAAASVVFFYVSQEEQRASERNENMVTFSASEDAMSDENELVSKPDDGIQNIAAADISLVPNELKEQISEVMQSYVEISKYPPTSQPIINHEHVNSFVNMVKPESSLPYPFDGLAQPIQLSISLDEYNYFYGETIKAAIQVGDIPENASVSARTALMSSDGETLVEGSVNLINDGSQLKQMESIFDTLSYNTDDWPLEMNAVAHVDVDGHKMFISAPFRINKETASVSSVDFSEPSAENLEIPVKLDVSLAGYYYLAGVLYSSVSGQPLIHLEAEGELSEGSDALILKAHIQALKKGGDEGPYELKYIRVERWSDELIPMDVAGKVPEPSYYVEGYQFSDFDDQPYIDPLKKERLQLMQGLSSL